MPYRISQEASLKGQHSLKQTQRLMLSQEMQQALHLLQLPLMELSQKLEEEIDLNPILEIEQEDESDPDEPEEVEAEHKEMDFEDGDFSILTQIDDEFSDLVMDLPKASRTQEDAQKQTFLEASILDEPSLYEVLMRQCVDTFDNEEDLNGAEILVGYIDDHGFLSTPLKEIASRFLLKVKDLERILKEIQTFDPPGVGAKNLQESLLIQLVRQNKEESLAYKIVEKCYDNLLHNRIPAIQKTLKKTTEEITKEIEVVISKLDNHPGLTFSKSPTPYITPDVKVEDIDGVLEVIVNTEFLPPLRLSPQYLKMLRDKDLPEDTRKFIEEKVHSAKWLIKIVGKRESTLQRIVKSLVHRDRDYFLNPSGKLKPLTLKTIADELELHESTIARAVQNKYLSCPRGTLPLRSFFTSTFVANDGEEVSSSTVREILLSLIQQEDKSQPLSDDALSKIIQAKGIPCARRTIAKFRAAMGLGNQHQRRKF